MARCCCCIPLRTGVFLLALFFLAINASETVLLFLKKQEFYGFLGGVRQDIVNGIFYSSVALSILFTLGGLFGVVGALAANWGMVIFFNVVNWCLVLLTLVSSFGAWIYFLVERDTIVKTCEENPGWLSSNSSAIGVDPNNSYSKVVISSQSKDDCGPLVKKVIIILGVSIFVYNIFAVYFASVVGSYASRLKRFNQQTKLSAEEGVRVLVADSYPHSRY